MARDKAPRLSEADLLALIDVVRAIVWRADARTFQTTFASKGAFDVLGYPVELWITVPGFWVEHLHPDDRDWVIAFTSGETAAGRNHDFEYRMIAADGEVVWLRNIVKVISVNGEPVELIGVTTEITERKRTEIELEELRVQLTRVARAATLGEVAATLAHELNQPLGAIASNTETAQLRLRSGLPADQVRAILDDVHADAHRAGEILHRVHTFLQWHKGDDQRRLDVTLLIDGVMRMMRPILAARQVDSVVVLDPPLPPVRGDPVQIQQVLVNLIRNAIDAMAGTTTERKIRVRAVRAGNMVQLSVSDNGCGIATEIAPRLFQPFATTKPGGLGMGLAISRRIVEAHGGKIRAESDLSGGTTVSFTIPVDASPEA